MVDSDTVAKVLAEFYRQGVKEVYRSECCGRVYIGHAPAASCRTCGKLPTSTLIQTKPLDNPVGG